MEVANDKRTARQIEAAKRVEFAKDRAGIGSKKQTPTLIDYAKNVFLPNVRVEDVGRPNTVAYHEQSIGRLTYFVENT